MARVADAGRAVDRGQQRTLMSLDEFSKLVEDAGLAGSNAEVRVRAVSSNAPATGDAALVLLCRQWQ